jgi:hypothetical protein
MKVKEAGFLYPSDLITVLEDDLSHRDIAGRVDLSNATEGYPLAVGEEAIINFTDATSVPLRIAVVPNASYQLILLNKQQITQPVDGSSTLLINNTVYSNAFSYQSIYCCTGTTVYAGTSSSINRFLLGKSWNGSTIVILNDTPQYIYCSVYDFNNDTYNGCGRILLITQSFDKSNILSWTSLGTIIFPQSSSGQILIRRLV